MDTEVRVVRHLTELRPSLVQLGWLALTAYMLFLFTVGQWYLYVELQVPCAGAPCADAFYLTAREIVELYTQGYDARSYAAGQVALYTVFLLIHIGVANLIFWQGFDDPMARFTALGLLLWSATFPSVPVTLWQTLPTLGFLMAVGAVIGGTFFYLFLFIFPSGSFAPHWMRWVALVFVLMSSLGAFISLPPMAVTAFARSVESFRLPFSLVLICAAIASQVYRYLRVSNNLQRLQTRWVLFGIVGGLGWIFTILLYVFFIDPALQHGAMNKLLFNGLIYLGFLLMPLSIAMAILRSHLYDIDVIVNRTLVYVVLTVLVVGLYILVVGYLGSIFNAHGNLLVSLIATGLVAVLFQPPHARVQRAINRLLWGERDEPYAVIRRLGQRLEATLAPDAVLPTIVETVAHALRLPYVAITLPAGDHDVTVAHGNAVPDLLCLPLHYQGEIVGTLVVAPRTQGASFTRPDRQLLDVLTDQAAVAVHAVQLNATLQHMTAALQQSRERLVAAREEERLRLRRDLHDGVGPTLASLAQRLDLATGLIEQDAKAAQRLLRQIKGQVKETLGDIRRLVYALRPPVLDQLGLVSAIQEQAMQLGLPEGVRIMIDADHALPPLPAAVEVAAYRIVLEALTNVVRHAHAERCTIVLQIADMDGRQALLIEVTDNGQGLHTTSHQVLD